MPGAVVAAGAAAAAIGITSTTVATTLVSLAISFGFGVLRNALFSPKRSGLAGAEAGFKLNPVVASPVYRRAYGRLRLGGYLVGRESVGDTLYLAFLMQSWPSAGEFTLQLDGREVPIQGDPYNLAGAGGLSWDPAPGTEDEPHDLLTGNVRLWIGTGAQTGHPADIAAEAPDFAATYHHFPGATVAWLALDVGDAASRSARWPNGQPVVTLEGKWSLLLDPRDGSVGWSANPALIIYDCLRLRDGFDAPDSRIDLGLIRAAATICAEPVAAKTGTVPRYEAHGLMEFEDYTAADLVEGPLAACMGRLDEWGGKWRLTVGRHAAPTVIVTGRDILDDLDIGFVRDPATMANTCRAQFVAPDRLWEVTPLPDYVDEAAKAVDGDVENLISLDLRWVTSLSQAVRIQRRAVALTRPERRIAGRWRPSMLSAQVGARARVAFAELPGADGEYVVESWGIGFEPVDEEAGLYKLDVSMALEEVSEDADLHDPTTEPDLDAALPVQRARVIAPPSGLSVVPEYIESGDGTTTVLAARVAFTPSPSAAVDRHELRWRDGSGLVFGPVRLDPSLTTGVAQPLTAGAAYTFQLRAVALSGNASPWVEISETIAPPGAGVAAPDAISSSATGGTALLVFGTPDEAGFRTLRLLRSATGAFVDAVEVQRYGAVPNAELSLGDTPGTGTWTWFATSIDKWGVESGPSSGLTETLT